MNTTAIKKRWKNVRNCWQIFYLIAGTVLLIAFGSQLVSANYNEQATLNERVQIVNKGYTEKTVYLESSEELSISRFDWISFMINGEIQKFKIKSFTVSGKSIELTLIENVPAGGKVSQLEYYVGFINREKLNFPKPDYEQLSQEQLNKKTGNEEVELIAETAEKVVDKNDTHPKVAKTSKVATKEERRLQKIQIEKRICEVFHEDCATAIAVAKAESALNPKAIGDRDILINGSIGIFQINKDVHDYPMSDLLDPFKNIEIARKVFDDRKKLKGNGWLAWGAYTNGSYRRHL